MSQLSPGKYGLTIERKTLNTKGNKPPWVRKILTAETINIRYRFQEL